MLFLGCSDAAWRCPPVRDTPGDSPGTLALAEKNAFSRVLGCGLAVLSRQEIPPETPPAWGGTGKEFFLEEACLLLGSAIPARNTPGDSSGVGRHGKRILFGGSVSAPDTLLKRPPA